MEMILKSKGKEYTVLYDDEDHVLLSKFNWYINRGYVRGRKREKGQYKMFMMHRIIANTPYNFFTDHVNRNKLDNRKVNLRVCTASDNKKNVNPTGKSQYLGVSVVISKRTIMTQKYGLKTYIDKPKFQSAIKANGTYIVLGRFRSEIDAAIAYDEAAKKYHGEFANLNFKNT